MPDEWEFQVDPENAVLIVNDVPSGVEASDAPSKPLSLFRMIVVLQEMREVPAYFPPNGRYTLEYDIFNYTTRYKVSARRYLEQQMDFIPLNKIRLFHFYSNTRRGLQEYLQSTPKLKISLLCDGELVGNAECKITDFANEIVIKKEYFEMFAGIEIKTAYLKCMIGIVEGNLENVSNIKLKAHKGIFIPPEDYTYAEPMPEEWLEMLPNLNAYSREIKQKYGIAPTPRSVRSDGSKSQRSMSIPRGNGLNRSGFQLTSSTQFDRTEFATRVYLPPAQSAPKRRVKSANPRRPQQSAYQARQPRPPSVSKPQSDRSQQHRRSSRQPLSASQPINKNPLDLDAKIWAITVQIHQAYGLPLTGSAWKIIFDVFGSKYTGEEFSRKDESIAFNLKKRVYLQGSPDKVKQALLQAMIIFKIYRNEDVGSVNIPLSTLGFNEDLQDVYPVQFTGAYPNTKLKVSLNLQQEKEPPKGDLTVVRTIPPGVDLIKV